MVKAKLEFKVQIFSNFINTAKFSCLDFLKRIGENKNICTKKNENKADTHSIHTTVD